MGAQVDWGVVIRFMLWAVAVFAVLAGLTWWAWIRYWQRWRWHVRCRRYWREHPPMRRSTWQPRPRRRTR